MISFLVLLFFAAPAYGIFGGHDAPEGKYPFVVSLSSYVPVAYREVHWCGGSLINERWVLTAAHCITQFSKESFNVSVGSYSLTGPRAYYVAESTFIHPGYNQNRGYENNVGLVQVDRDIIFNDNVKPAKLPRSFSEPIGDTVQIAGWGIYINLQPSNYLREISAVIMDSEECQAKEKRDTITEGKFCTADEVVCTYDDGGPVVNNDGILVGIVPYIRSGGLQGCKKGTTRVFPRVSSYLDWIDQTIAQNDKNRYN